MPERVCTLWNSITEVLCATKIEKLHTYVGLQVEIMQKKGLGKKNQEQFQSLIKADMVWWNVVTVWWVGHSLMGWWTCMDGWYVHKLRLFQKNQAEHAPGHCVHKKLPHYSLVRIYNIIIRTCPLGCSQLWLCLVITEKNQMQWNKVPPIEYDLLNLQ